MELQKTIKTINFLGLKISQFNYKNDIKNLIIESVYNKKRIIIFGHSFGTIGLMRKYPQIYILGNLSDLLVFDGRLFYLFARFMGIKSIIDLSLPDTVILALDIANEKKFSVFLLGATEEINKTAIQMIKQDYPNIKEIDGMHGYFEFYETPSVLDKINEFEPDILLIGMAPPKKEDFVINYKNKINSRVIILCGGMIDVLAGKYTKTPKFIKKIGLASIFRLIQEPRRLWKRYLFIFYTIIIILLPRYIFSVITGQNDFSIQSALNIKEK